MPSEVNSPESVRKEQVEHDVPRLAAFWHVLANSVRYLLTKIRIVWVNVGIEKRLSEPEEELHLAVPRH